MIFTQLGIDMCNYAKCVETRPHMIDTDCYKTIQTVLVDAHDFKKIELTQEKRSDGGGDFNPRSILSEEGEHV